MEMERILKSDEWAAYRLRALYHEYGYTEYKVSKFEEYDFYANNRSFLFCENILTFTDTSGKLLALKPDVTLSVVKNLGTTDTATHKVSYSESVYRTTSRSEGFREIRQTGLECIGKLDLYLVGEVVMLAKKSLALIDDRHVLDVSHMGFLLGLLSEYGVSDRDSAEMLSYMANKNLPAVKAFCRDKGLPEESGEAIAAVTEIYGALPQALEKIGTYVRGERMQTAYDELLALCDVLKAWGADENVNLDLSLSEDRNYYNGIVFRGFVQGVPEAILSGGRYDSLLRRMGKKAEAIGFAVYPELISLLGKKEADGGTDAVLLYEKSVPAVRVVEAIRALENEGKTVSAVCDTGRETVSGQRVYRLSGKGDEILEAMD